MVARVRRGTSEELLEKFDLTGLRQDDMSPDAHIPLKRVWKWDESIRIHIANDKAEAEREFLAGLATLLGRLTGLSISLDEGDRTISVRVVAQEEYHSKSLEITGYRSPHSAGGMAVCGTYGDRGRIPKGHVIVTYIPDRERVRHLLLTEITQCLGPGGDFGDLQPSVFTISGSAHTRLPLNDQIILRTLYDPRIPPGMLRDYALAAASEIIPMLLQKLEEEGPEGLHQQISE